MTNIIIVWSIVSIAIIIILSCYLFPNAIRINRAKKGAIINLFAESEPGKIIYDKKILVLVYRYSYLADISKFLIITNDGQCPSYSFAFIPGLIGITVAATKTIPTAIEIREATDQGNFLEPMAAIRFEEKDLLKIK